VPNSEVDLVFGLVFVATKPLFQAKRWEKGDILTLLLPLKIKGTLVK